MQKIPSINEARNSYSVNRLDATEGIRQSLYDYLIYPTAGQTQFTFFQQPQGAGLSSHPLNANNVKGIWDTNMESAGQLPNPKRFLIESIEVVFEPGSVATANTFTVVSPIAFAAIAAATVGSYITDINLIRQVGTVGLFIGSKYYLRESHIGRFPPKVRPEFTGAAANTSATTGEIFAGTLKQVGRPYFVEPAIFLESTQNFSVDIVFPAAQPTPSGFNGRIGIVLDGYLYRNSQ